MKNSHSEFSIRPFDNADATVLYDLLLESKDKILTTAFWRKWSKTDFHNYINNSNSPESVKNCICVKIGEEFRTIGAIELNDINWIHGRAEVGIFILNKEFRNRGAGTYAINFIVDWAFKTLRLHRVYCKVFANNLLMIKVLEKTGFEKEGTLKRHFFFEGEYLNAVLFGKLSEKENGK